MNEKKIEQLSQLVVEEGKQISANTLETLDDVSAAFQQEQEEKESEFAAMFDKYFSQPFESEEDQKMKEAAVLVERIAEKKGLVEKQDVLTVTSNVDQGYETAKCMYKVATGEIDMQEAADRLIDVAVTKVTAVADKAIDREYEMLPLLVKAVPTKYKPIAIIATQFLQAIKPEVKKFVPKVIKATGDLVKKELPKIVDYAKEIAKSLLSSRL